MEPNFTVGTLRNTFPLCLPYVTAVIHVAAVATVKTHSPVT